MPTVAFPLVFVLVINAAKDGFEDWKRHQADEKENGIPVLIVNPRSGSHDVESRKYLRPRPDSKFEDRCHEGALSLDIEPVESAEFAESAGFVESAVVHDEPAWGSIIADQIMPRDVGDDFDVEEFPPWRDNTIETQPDPVDLETLVASGTVERTAWANVRVGDIVMCRNKERFPADLILLASSNELGLAFIETSSLDGETNLKVKQPHASTAGRLGIKSPESVDLAKQTSGTLTCSPPDADLHFFEGSMKYNIAGAAEESIPLTINQLLLRGCGLRNTTWILGLVVYTGKETKIQMNSADPPHKVSRIEASTNWLTLIVFCCQLLICLTGALATYFISSSDHYRQMTYLNLSQSSVASQSIFRFLTWLVLFVNMIPISLIVTMGMVKAAQGVFIGMDSDMYHSQTQTYAVARTTDLNEELGQVQYIFTDKTGTVTRNCMEFRRCGIHGHSYGKGLTEIRRNVLRKQGAPVPPDPIPSPGEPITPSVNICDDGLRDLIRGASYDAVHSRVLDFFIHLAVNQAVVPEADATPGSIVYSASSPDEGALVYAACHYDVVFVRRVANGLVLRVNGEEVVVEILANIEFTSTRKRSSVVCLFPQTNAEKLSNPDSHHLLANDRYVVYCKGADSVILSRIENVSDEDRECIRLMEEYAVDGLRTLCIAKAELPADEAKLWKKTYDEACLAVEDRVTLIEKAAELIERNFELQGVTGIEDKLQHGVGETLDALQEAGINIWMLTGDKAETAINIGVATNLLRPYVHQNLYLWDSLEGTTDAEKKTSLRMLLEKGLEETKQYLREQGRDISEFTQKKSSLTQSLRRFLSYFCASTAPFTRADTPDLDELETPSIVIDGGALSKALEPDLRLTFVHLCAAARTVICCRVTPYQKGAVVKLVREILGKVTMAVGDGANDCNMIQSADVGVGLRGSEGMQAFNSSDIGISQFRFIRVLLLCHGRWCYRRLSRLVLYMFYKNLVAVLPIFYFAFFSLYSGQKIYNELLYQLYNVLLTSVPVIIFGVFDQDVNRQLSLAFPALYRTGHVNAFFNTGVFCRWILNGFVASLVIALIPLRTFAGNQVLSDGMAPPLWVPGHVTFWLVMIVVNFKIILESASLTWVMWLAIFISFLSWVLSFTVFTSWPEVGSEMLGLQFVLLREPFVYIVIIATAICCFSWDLIWKIFRINFQPESYHVIQKATRYMPEIQEFPQWQIDARFRGGERFRFSRRLGHSDTCSTGILGSRAVIRMPSKTSGISGRKQSRGRFNTITSRGYAFSEADTKAVAAVRLNSRDEREPLKTNHQ